MPVESESLGRYLRQERERRHIALPDVAAATKIQLKFLEALERDAYDQLPAEPFVLGFLRAYAQHVAIDPATVLAAYRTAQRLPGHTTDPAASPPPLTLSPPARRSVLRLGLLAVLAGLLVLAVLYELRRGQPSQGTVTSFPAVPGPSAAPPARTTASAPAAPRSEPTREAPPSVSLPTAGPSVPPVARPSTPLGGASEATAPPPLAVSGPAVPTPPPTPSSAEPARTLVLEATAVSDTWLGIEIDGGKRQNILLTSGKSTQWEAQDRFRITVGNARGTRLALNGQDIALQGGRSNVVRELVLSRAQLP